MHVLDTTSTALKAGIYPKDASFDAIKSGVPEAQETMQIASYINRGALLCVLV